MIPFPTDTLMQASALTSLPLAYLDPGTGSLIVQAVVGVVVSLLVALKVYWHKVKGLFRKKKVVAAPAPTPPSEPSAPESPSDGSS